ncbi:CHAT domain-containing tetratricopeptide repeat protein, partial [Leptolyngbya sp. FACHB-261]|uniref:CHAT domain-containing protein n=1 Tax=Leptolyngbya sp. FACHB-261 TaxID=2692806 RepID=UPI001682E5C4
RAVGDRSGEATTLNNIGLVYDSLGDKQQALSYYNQALPLRRAVGDRSGEATTLNNIGLVYDSLGDKQQALSYYNQALPLRRAVGDRSGEATTLNNIAYVKRDQGKLSEAKAQIEAAIGIVESLRTKVISQDLRASYFASVQNYYKLYVGLLMQLHKQQPAADYDALALYASERSRARSLLELLTEARADIRQGVDPQLLARERSLQQRLSTIEERQITLLTGEQTEERVAVIRQELEALQRQYDEVETQIRTTSPRYAALTQPQPLTLSQIQQQVLDDNTMLLEYSLGEERSYLWAVTKTGITSYELPKRSEIEAAARQFYAFLTVPSQRIRTAKAAESGTALSQILLGPVAAQLGQKRLLIVADGALQYIPFGTLPIPQPREAQNKLLIAEHEIVNLPSASTLAIIRRDLAGRSLAAKTIAVLADPVFGQGNERVRETATRAISSRDAQQFPPLPGTRVEADQLLALVPTSERFQAFGPAASRETVTSGRLSQYRFVHFATHGLLNDQDPGRSGIALSSVDQQGTAQDSFLFTQDIFNLNLPAELVVVSGCRTGLGQEIRGEGLVGLTRGFMYAGAKRVVVSLWSVEDDATAELMTRFYREMLKNRQPPTAALRAAQLSMSQDPRWQNPYYWAGFIIQGEWK